MKNTVKAAPRNAAKKKPAARRRSRKIEPPPLYDGSYPTRPIHLPAWMVDRLEQIHKIVDSPNGPSGMIEALLHPLVTEDSHRDVGDVWNDSEDLPLHECVRIENRLQDLGKKWNREGIKPPEAYAAEMAEPLTLPQWMTRRLSELADAARFEGPQELLEELLTPTLASTNVAFVGIVWRQVYDFPLLKKVAAQADIAALQIKWLSEGSGDLTDKKGGPEA